MPIVRSPQNNSISHARFHLCRVKNVMPFSAQPVDERLIQILVGDEIYTAAPAVG